MTFILDPASLFLKLKLSCRSLVMPDFYRKQEKSDPEYFYYNSEAQWMD